MKLLCVLLMLAMSVCLVRSAQRAGRNADEFLDEVLLAAWDGDHAKLAEFMRRGIDPNTELAGMTLLGITASRGHRAATECLIRCGADVDLRVPGGQTPLMLAAVSGDAATVRALLGCGADVNATDQAGFTVLMYALLSCDPERVRLALYAGADADRRNGRGTHTNDVGAGQPLILRVRADDEIGCLAKTNGKPGNPE